MSKRSHPEEITTNEPSPKKQAITPEMYKKLEVKIAELEKRNIDAQEMTQKQIEKFQDRTAKAEEKLSKIKELYNLIEKIEIHIKNSQEILHLLKTEYTKKIGSGRRLEEKLSNEINSKTTYLTHVKESIKQLLTPKPQPSTLSGSRGKDFIIQI